MNNKRSDTAKSDQAATEVERYLHDFFFKHEREINELKRKKAQELFDFGATSWDADEDLAIFNLKN